MGRLENDFCGQFCLIDSISDKVASIVASLGSSLETCMVWLYKLPNSCIALLFGVIGAALFVGVLFLRVKLLRIQVQSD